MVEGLAVVVLAAGLSRRFGARDKLEQPLAGKPLACHVADTLAEFPTAHRMVVSAAATGPVAAHFLARDFELIINPDPASGQGRSLALAAERAAAIGATGLLVCLADMPYVTDGLLRRLAERWAADPTISLISACETYRGPPALFPRSSFGPLQRLRGERGGRELLAQAHPVPARPDELRDFDYPADFGAP